MFDVNTPLIFGNRKQKALEHILVFVTGVTVADRVFL